jgi:alpha-tubulin suppressor-like RCC1 family protein
VGEGKKQNNLCGLMILPILGPAENIYAGGKPAEVKPAPQKAIAVSAGWDHACALISDSKSRACALLTDGSVPCWGANGEGQLGDGTRDSRNVPVKVLGLGP